MAELLYQSIKNGTGLSIAVKAAGIMIRNRSAFDKKDPANISKKPESVGDIPDIRKDDSV